MRKILIVLSILFGLITACKSDNPTVDTSEATTRVKEQAMKDGPYLEYHESGEIKIVGEYKNGLRSGLWSSWFTNGELQSELNYINGLEEGVYKVFHSNGNLKIKGFYTKGKASSVWIFFDENGKETNRKNYDA